MNYEILGEIAQVARLRLDRGDEVWASRGSLVSYTSAIDWQLRIPGGVGGAMRRSLSGEGISLLRVTAMRPGQVVALGANAPGRIREWDLDADGPVVTTRGAFLAAWGESVDISVTVARRAGAAFFGGAGLFLQRISGRGKALVHGSGDFEDRRLAEGESIVVSTGNLAAFAESVDYSIQGVGGVRKFLFSGEGLFMTRLTGPGRVLLQTLKRSYGSSGPRSG